MRALRRIERLLFVIAALALGTYGYFWAERTFFQWRQSRNLDRLLTESQEPAPSSADQTAPGRPLGRIEIPRLKLSAIVVEGADGRALQLGVGHIPGTALPGRSGNVGLAGHRDTFFRPLRKIRKGDEIHLTSPAGTSDYIVRSTAIVEPQYAQVLKASTQSSLTLVTCYPFDFIGAAPKRFVVEAQKVDIEEPALARPSPTSARKPLLNTWKAAQDRTVKTPEDEIAKRVDSAERGESQHKPDIRPKRSVLRTLSFPLRKTLGWIKPH